MKIAVCGMAALFVLSAQPAQDIQPTCRNCAAAYIGSDELHAYVQRAMAKGIIDQQVRATNVGKANVGVAVVHRGKLASPAPDSVAEHDLVSEIYHVIDGSGTMVTGAEMLNVKRRPADQENVRMLNGPGNGAASIRNGVVHELKTGDVIVVPAGTGHWFTKIDDHITYLMIRIDPDKVTPLKDEAASKADLANSNRTPRGQ